VDDSNVFQVPAAIHKPTKEKLESEVPLTPSIDKEVENSTNQQESSIFLDPVAPPQKQGSAIK
jgi:hypothetical protein